MIIKKDSLHFNVKIDEGNLNSGKMPIILLHGFTGSSNDWDFIFDKLPKDFFPVAVDLVGHGKSSSPIELDHYTPVAQIAQLDSIRTELGFGKVILCGYSMGGRLALSYAIKYPQKIEALILESASKGLQNETDKSERLKNDFALAEKINSDGIEKFIDYWMKIPLFNTLNNLSGDKYKSIVLSKLNNSVTGLSNSLRGFSTGNMDIELHKLNNANIPVLLITGRLDTKFTNINKYLKNEFKNAVHEVIDNAGHNTHTEKEEEYISIVTNFLINFF